MTTTTPTTTTEATEITIYRVAYLIETEEQDYELELWTDNEEEAWDCKGDFLNKRLKEIPELQEELNELLVCDKSHNYVEEHENTKEEYLNYYSKEYSIDEKYYEE